MIIAFSGHRPSELNSYSIPNPTYLSICRKTKHILEQLKPEKAYVGMALGYDMWCANICRLMNIPFIAAIPMIGQEKLWNENDQKLYHKLLSFAAETVIVSEGSYSAAKMHIRNQYMVDRSDVVIGCWNGKESGGTYACLSYARSKNKQVIIVDPNS